MFFSDASPVRMRPSIFSVNTDSSHGLARALPERLERAVAHGDAERSTRPRDRPRSRRPDDADAPRAVAPRLGRERDVGDARRRARTLNVERLARPRVGDAARRPHGERTGVPSIATMRSPARRPARSAGLPGSTCVDQRRAEVAACRPSVASEVALPVGGVASADDVERARRPGRALLPSRSTAERDALGALRLDQPPAQRPASCRPARRRRAVTRSPPRRPASAAARARGRLGEQRALARHAGHVRAGEQHDREQEVGDRARRRRSRCACRRSGG